MGLNINITGVKVSGNAKVLNGLNVGENSNTKVEINNTSVQDNASVLNDVKVNGTLDYSLKDVSVNGNASILDGKIVNSGETFKDSMNGQSSESKEENYTYDSTEDIRKLKEELENLKMGLFLDDEDIDYKGKEI